MSLIKKIEVAYDVICLNMTRTNAADIYGISQRTVGRYIQDIKEKIANGYEFEDDSDVCALSIGEHKDVIHMIEEMKAIIAETKEETQKEEVKVVEEDNAEFKVLATRKSVSISKIISDRVIDTVTIDNKNECFDLVLEKLINSKMDQDTLKECYFLCRPKTKIEIMYRGKLKIDPIKEVIYFKPSINEEYTISGLLSSRIIQSVKEGDQSVEKHIKFMEKLMENPSNRSVNELYGFLTHNDIEITEDGNFYAWKVVTSDYKDCYTKTIDNSIGVSPSVPRNQVDENSDRTCSHGLHVCAKHYIGSFRSNGDRVVKVEVNPADVVAIPKDYNDSKMRCCGYKVVEDVTHMF